MQAQIPGQAAAKKPGARHDPVYVDVTVRRWKQFTGIYLRNANTELMCERFEQRARFYLQQYQAANGGLPLPITVYGDATGQARSTSSKTDYDLIREYFRAKGQFRIDYARRNIHAEVVISNLAYLGG